MGNETRQYNLATIRDLLLAAFTADELRQFCYYRKKFRPVVDRFGPKQGFDDMVHELITYCDRKLLFPELLAEIEKTSPAQYSEYKERLFVDKEPQRETEREIREPSAGVKEEGPEQDDKREERVPVEQVVDKKPEQAQL
ncbi:MAG TPA: hypothetical protein VLY63_33515, partial [Anaerolineae bacterium]|nr:hypothetical protein [Anaerolineae bacterium]